MSRDVLPDHLKDEIHKDWPFPFKYVPRAWTSFAWGKPELVHEKNLDPTKDFDRGAPKPITSRGSFQISVYPDAPSYWTWAAWYVAYTFKDGHQFRIGARWDNVDNYVTWPTFPTTRVYKEDGNQDTQNWLHDVRTSDLFYMRTIFPGGGRKTHLRVH